MNIVYEQHFLLFIVCACAAVLGFLGCKAYIYLWNFFASASKTPTGYGVIATIIVFCLSLAFGFEEVIYFQLFVLLIFTLAYWFDDLVNLSPFIRTCFSLILALLLINLSSLSLYDFEKANSIFLLVSLLFIYLTLVNFINFCDGADLNLATLIILYGIGCSFVLPLSHPLLIIALLWSFFTFGFGCRNFIPKTIYLGDSGSFSFSGIIFISILMNLEPSSNVSPTIFIPLAFPLLDNTFVIIYRILRRENLLTRNFYQLYQRIQINKKTGFLYLLPQIQNFILCWLGVLLLTKMGFNDEVATLISIALVTPFVYFACFYLWGGLSSLRLNKIL